MGATQRRPRFGRQVETIACARRAPGPRRARRLRSKTDVPLGPWYLVWDNISNPALLAEGASNWPYQVHEVNLVSLSESALAPDGLAADLREGAGLAKRYCQQCHKVNGFGGEKFPGNLATLARVRSEPEFIRWVLHPLHGTCDNPLNFGWPR